VILGARTVEQLQENLAAADLQLPPEVAGRLTEVSAPQQPDYPYGPKGVAQRERKIQGGR
jgi:aryl-alcohol dehydrogenase-like predicted oxidoreductase